MSENARKETMNAKVLVQDFLRGGGTLAQLQERYRLLVKRHPSLPNLAMLKYHHIDSPMGEPLVQQCRGLILDEANNWAIVAYPFDKFFNHGEGNAAPVEWASATVLEKLDGSLMILYHHDGRWHVASSGTPDAGGKVNGCGFSFQELFWRVWNEKGHELPPDSEADKTFMFELMTPYNRVVVRHQKNDLKLIGVRDRLTGVESSAAEWAHRGEPVRSLSLDSIAEIERTFGSTNPLEMEGYVVVDAQFRRVKVKHPGYVALHNMRDGFGPRRILEVIRMGESSELLSYFPEWAEAFGKVRAVYDDLVGHLESEFTRLKDIPIQKDFALEAMKTRHSATLFQLRNGSVKTVRESLASAQIRGLMETLALKDIEL